MGSNGSPKRRTNLRQLEAKVETLRTETAKIVNQVSVSVAENVKQIWDNQRAIEDQVKLLDRQLMILIRMLEINGVKVPAPDEELEEDAEPNQPEA